MPNRSKVVSENLFLIFIAIVALTVRGLDSYFVSTLAGSGSNAVSSDGVVAQGSPIKLTFSVWAATNGVVYFTEASASKVRTVSTSGILGTFAGGCSSCTSSYGVAATSFSLSSPYAVWGSGSTVYIADNGPYKIYSVTNGIISWFAGAGGSIYTDGQAATSTNIYNTYGIAGDTMGSVYLATYSSYRVVKVSNSIVTSVGGTGSEVQSSDGGPATSTTLGSLYSVAVDSTGDVYVGEEYYRIRRISSGIISTFVGTGSSGTSNDGLAATSTNIYGYSQGVNFDTTGVLFYSDFYKHKVKAVTSSGGIVYTIAGTGSGGSSGNYGSATAANLYSPTGVFVTSSTTIYVCEKDNYMIRSLITSTPPTPLPTTIAPSCGPTSKPTYTPVAAPTGYSMSAFAGTTVSGSTGNGGPATSATLSSPYNYYYIFVDSLAVVYYSDSSYRVRKITTDGIINAFLGSGTTSVNSGDGGAATSANLYQGAGVWGDTNGKVFVMSCNFRVRKVETGVVTTYAGTGANGYSGDGGQATAASISGPYALSCDSLGVLYIQDNGYYRIRKIDSNGIITTFAGTGSSSSTGDGGKATSCGMGTGYAMIVDTNGVFYFGDNYKIRTISASQIVSVYAGTSTSGSSGDGGAATSSLFSSPFFLWIDSVGKLFVSDQTNYKVKMIVSSVVYTVAGTGDSGTSYSSGYATSSPFTGFMGGIGSDSAGNLYITDYAVIRKLQTVIFPTVSPTANPTTPTVAPTMCPTLLPSCDPSCVPTKSPSAAPTFQPSTVAPSVVPTSLPSLSPTSAPSIFPTISPSIAPSVVPSLSPSLVPSLSPSFSPSVIPSMQPTIGPSNIPTVAPSMDPSVAPSHLPSALPTLGPTNVPTAFPSLDPSVSPSFVPSLLPSAMPSVLPTTEPTITPSIVPSSAPFIQPSLAPSWSPTSIPSALLTTGPSLSPTAMPSLGPSVVLTPVPSLSPTVKPSLGPSVIPTILPSLLPSTTPSVQPTMCPTIVPTALPSLAPLDGPSPAPSLSPSSKPSCKPTLGPTSVPTVEPSFNPSTIPSTGPSLTPSKMPSAQPTIRPTLVPTAMPSLCPSVVPTPIPSMSPSLKPSFLPTECPSFVRSVVPSLAPSIVPSLMPSVEPTVSPSVYPTEAPSSSGLEPSCSPSVMPSVQPTIGPTNDPSAVPSTGPSATPSPEPSLFPSVAPSIQPTVRPSVTPSVGPSILPSMDPSPVPSIFPSTIPSVHPTLSPSNAPSVAPTMLPSLDPSIVPSNVPSTMPSIQPTLSPSSAPSMVPSVRPSIGPSLTPSLSPSAMPSYVNSSVDFASSLGVSVVGVWSTAFKIVLPYAAMGSVSIVSALTDIDANFALDLPYLCVVLGQVAVGLSVKYSKAVMADSSKRSVAVADFDGDRNNDLIVGDPQKSRCYVLFGTIDGLTRLTSGFTVFGEKDSDMTGWSVSDAGDVNNDTLHDIIIGAPLAKGVGAFYVIYGRNADISNIHLDQLDSSIGFVVYGTVAGDYLGISVSGAGDFNGDGFDDVVVGAVLTSKYYAGGALVMYGNNSIASSRMSEVMIHQGFLLTGASYSYTGCSVSGAGDVNGDGYDDIIIGSDPQRSSLSPKAFVVFGPTKLSNSLLSSLSSSIQLQIIGGAKVVGSVGDANDDGFDDVFMISGFPSDQNGMLVVSNTTFMTLLSESPSSGPTVISTIVPSTAPTTRNPTFAPSKKPTRQPSIATAFPTHGPMMDVEGSLSPTEVPTLEPSESPTMLPSESPSELPSNAPSRLPTVSPSVSPTTELPSSTVFHATAAPSLIPRIHHPLSVPTLSPSNTSTSVSSLLITSGTHLQDQTLSGMSYTVDTADTVAIYNPLGNNTYFVIPNMGGLLVIEYFNKTNDLIDLTAFPSITAYSQLLITSGSVIITLPNSQIVRIMNLYPHDINGSNFILAPDFVRQDSDNKVASSLSVIVGVVIVLAGLIFLLFLFSKCYTSPLLEVKPKTVERFWLFKVDVLEQCEECEQDIESILSGAGEWLRKSKTRLDPNDEYDNGAQHYCEVEENSRFQDLAQWEMYNKLLLSHGGSDMHSRYLLSKETLLSQLD